MEKILILYATKEGQTDRIAHRLAGKLSGSGLDVDTVHVTELQQAPDLPQYDAVVIGGSVHRGSHAKELIGFVQDHRSELGSVPSAFFSVSMAQAHPAEPNQLEAESYVRAFLEKTGWRPDVTERFAGALAYTRYNWIVRQIMKQISKTAGHSTDTSRDHVYTDWDRVDAFADEIVHLAQRRGTEAPEPPEEPSEPETVEAAGSRTAARA